MSMILQGDAMTMLSTLDAESVDCVVTSPPYWGLRDYGMAGQIGLEETPEQYVSHMRLLFEQVRRVLKPQGTLWLNLGDSYGANSRMSGNRATSEKQKTNLGSDPTMRRNGVQSKQLIGIPWRMALALQSDGWYLRQDIIWHKPNPMPESVRDRCTKSHEYIFLLAKSAKYYFDIAAICEPSKEFIRSGERGREKFDGESFVQAKQRGWGNNCGVSAFRQKRSVWTVTTKPFKGAHFATFPPDLIEPCILAGCPIGGTVLDPFFGAGTTGLVAKKHGRNYIGIELNPEYVEIAKRRLGHE